MKNSQFIPAGIRKNFALFIMLLLVLHTTQAQENTPITNAGKKAIIQTAIAQVQKNYVFPERAGIIGRTIMQNFVKKAYNQTKIFDFLTVLNKDLEIAGNDHHLNIFYGPQYVKKIRAADSEAGATAVPAGFISMIRYENFFLKKIERLDGNIGYFKFNKFEELAYSKEGISAAMNFISNASAIIFDLRQNGGGSAETVHYLMNYFLPDSTRLGTFKRRVNNEVINLYTEKDASIKKIANDIPVYILVSRSTSSAAEAFAYGLQQFGRATIVGEQTHGEANPGKRFVINDSLYMMIPTATSINIKTGTNWEGTGVTSDIKVTALHALSRAIIESCTILESRADDKNLKQLYQWMIPQHAALIDPQLPSPELVKRITGQYAEGKQITWENGTLYYVNSSGKFMMTYMGQNTFTVESKDYRLRFPSENMSEHYYEAVWMDGGTEKAAHISN